MTVDTCAALLRDAEAHLADLRAENAALRATLEQVRELIAQYLADDDLAAQPEEAETR